VRAKREERKRTERRKKRRKEKDEAEPKEDRNRLKLSPRKMRSGNLGSRRELTKKSQRKKKERRSEECRRDSVCLVCLLLFFSFLRFSYIYIEKKKRKKRKREGEKTREGETAKRWKRGGRLKGEQKKKRHNTYAARQSHRPCEEGMGVGVDANQREETRWTERKAEKKEEAKGKWIKERERG
jgi:hypothetical protein